MHSPSLQDLTTPDQARTDLLADESEVDKVLKASPDYVPALMARAAIPPRSVANPRLQRQLTPICYQRKEFVYAVQLLRRSLEKRPLDARLRYYLGMSHLKVDEKLQRREVLRQALAAGLPDPLASEAKSVLAELEKSK